MTEDKIFNIFIKMNDARDDKNKMDFYSFKMGWEASLLELDRQKAMNADRKAGKFIIEDFLNLSKDMIDIRYFLTGIYHDSGKQIACDGKYLVLHNSDYDKKLEGKIVRDGKEIEGTYPKYEKVIPDTKDMKTVDFLTAKDFQLIASTCKIKSMDKLYSMTVLIEKDSLHVAFPMAILKTVDKFFKCYPEAVLYMNCEDITKSWKAVDEKTGDLIVFMPCTMDKIECNSVYNVNDKSLVTVKK